MKKIFSFVSFAFFGFLISNCKMNVGKVSDKRSSVIRKSAFPENGKFAKDAMGLSLSGENILARTSSGMATEIPPENSILKSLGSSYAQIVDPSPIGFTLVNAGMSGSSFPVIYANDTLGYVDPIKKDLLYCRPQKVSSSGSEIAILDCMSVMQISKISATSKYPNGSPVFNGKDLLSESGQIIMTAAGEWKNSENATVVTALGETRYADGKRMRDTAGNLFLPDGVKIFNAAKTGAWIKFEDGKDFTTANSVKYRNGKSLSDSNPTTKVQKFYYSNGNQLGSFDRGKSPNLVRVLFPSGADAKSSDNKIFGVDGIEKPVESTYKEDFEGGALLFSVGRLYEYVVATQVGPYGTYSSIVDNTAGALGPTGNPTDVAPPPVGLQVTGASHRSVRISWESGGGSTASFVYAITAGTTAPSCTSASAKPIGMQTVVLVDGLSRNASYAVRVCAKNPAGKLNAGITATGKTNASAGKMILIATGPGPVTTVKGFNAQGEEVLSLQPFGTNYFGGATVATGDWNGDGVDDIIVGSSAAVSSQGGNTLVKIFSGLTLSAMRTEIHAAVGANKTPFSVGFGKLNGRSVVYAGATQSHVSGLEGGIGVIESGSQFTGYASTCNLLPALSLQMNAGQTITAGMSPNGDSNVFAWSMDPMGYTVAYGNCYRNSAPVFRDVRFRVSALAAGSANDSDWPIFIAHDPSGSAEPNPSNIRIGDVARYNFLGNTRFLDANLVIRPFSDSESQRPIAIAVGDNVGDRRQRLYVASQYGNVEVRTFYADTGEPVDGALRSFIAFPESVQNNVSIAAPSR